MLLLNTLAGTDEGMKQRTEETRGRSGAKKGAGRTLAAQHIRRGSHEATNRSSQRHSYFCVVVERSSEAAHLQFLLISFA